MPTLRIVGMGLLAVGGLGLAGCGSPGGSGGRAPDARPTAPRVLRGGAIAGLKPETIARCRQQLAAAPPEALKAIAAANIRNASIFLKDIDGAPFLFSYFEYAGGEFRADWDRLASDEILWKWRQEIDPCLTPLPRAARRGQIWDDLEEVFHTEGAIETTPKQVRRCAAITGLKFEKEACCRALLHAPWPGVLKQIHDANIRNYSIYLKDVGDKLYLFSYFEYVGDNFEADMAKISEDPTTRRWRQQTDPCQIPFPAAAAKGKIWEDMEEVFHAD